MNTNEQMERYERYYARTRQGMFCCFLLVAVVALIIAILKNVPIPLSESAKLEIQAIQDNSDHVFDIEGGTVITTSSGYEYIIDNSTMKMRATFDKEFTLLKAQEYFLHNSNTFVLCMIVFAIVTILAFGVLTLLNLIFDVKCCKYKKQQHNEEE